MAQRLRTTEETGLQTHTSDHSYMDLDISAQLSVAVRVQGFQGEDLEGQGTTLILQWNGMVFKMQWFSDTLTPLAVTYKLALVTSKTNNSCN